MIVEDLDRAPPSDRGAPGCHIGLDDHLDGETGNTSFDPSPYERERVLRRQFAEAARRTDELIPTLDLDAAQPLPVAPWFEPGGRWSARRVLLHLIAETVQHAGHADIIRESLDGAKTMG